MPWCIVDDNETGIVLRLGQYKRDAPPGLNWKLPLVEDVIVTSAALDSTALREQTLTTADLQQVTVRGVMTYRVSNPRRYILEVEDPESVVNDIGCSLIAEAVPFLSCDEVLTGDSFARELRKKMRARAKKWGVEVEAFGLMDRTKTRAFRLISGTGE